MSKLFSIIIPVYNVEEYIRRCFESIYSQSVPESIFEVIVVNDGTPDNSMSIVNEFSQIYSNIVVINKENGGVSSARNVGIANAQGDFLIFVDPDDYLCGGSLTKIQGLLENGFADMFILRSYKSNNHHEENYKWEGYFDTERIYVGRQLLEKAYIRGSVCGCVISRTFLLENRLVFPEGIANFEDTIFMLIGMCYAQCIKFADIDLYEVFVRDGSASTTLNKERVFKCVKGLEFVEQYKHTHNLSVLQISMLEYLKYSIISNATLYASKCKNLGYREFVSYTGIKKYLPIRTSLVKTQNIKIWGLNLSYYLFFLLMSIKNKR